MKLEAGIVEYPIFPDWNHAGYVVNDLTVKLMCVPQNAMDAFLANPNARKFTAWPLYISCDFGNATCYVYPPPNHEIELIVFRPVV